MKPVTIFILCFSLQTPAFAETLLVAVASNFMSTARVLQADYSKRSGEQVELSSGSTGMLFAKIMRGAPYDIFMAADAKHPQLLIENGRGRPGSQATYAIGYLALWSADQSLSDKQCLDALRQHKFSHLAIANPDTAPYGYAALQTLRKLGEWESLQDKLVRGENIGQAFRYVATGSAQLGFVAESQLQGNEPSGGCVWPVPQSYYSPLVQAAVIVSASTKQAQASGFMQYLASEDARYLIKEAGYGLPHGF